MDNKVVLVTGASSGFGKDYVEQLLARGHTVYAAARRVDRMADLKDQGAHVLSMDVTDDADVKAGVAKLIQEQGRIDVLVNNAGYGGYGMVEAVSMDEAHFQFEVNVFGPARLVKEVLPTMREQRSGTIINMSSVVGKVSSPMIGWYGASKQALEGWTDALRAEVKGYGIKVVLVEPGAVKTGFEEVAMKQLATVDHPAEYQANVDAFTNRFRKNYAAAPGPDAVVKSLVKAAESPNPKTRYVVGTDSKMAMTMTALLSDRAMDNVMRSLYGMK